MRNSRPRRLLPASAVLALAALLFAAPLAAYTVWLKDGSSISARDRYVVKDGKAIITLLNGTQSFIDAAQIDVARTEAANRGRDYGATDLGDTKVVAGAEAALPKNKSLTDLVATHSPSSRDLPIARRERDLQPGQLAHTKAGNLDFSSLPHTPFAHAEVTADLLQFLRGKGVEQVEAYAGSQSDRLLLLATISSEGSAFNALTASANALLRAREQWPGKVAAIELWMQNPGHERAGQFTLSPAAAADLVAGRTDVPSFYLANVEF
jgi:hypothetical protein